MLSTTLKPHHLAEFRASGISDELIGLNFTSVDQEDAFARLTYAIPQAELRRNDGRLRDKYLRRYYQLEEGGWAINGLDPDTHWTTDMEWGRVKPDCPRRDWDVESKTFKDKLIKYESPAKTPNRVIYLRVGLKTWEKVAQRHSLKMPPAIPVNPETGEAQGFWKWVQQHPQVSIALAEGSKKAAFLLSRGFVTIALPGIYCGTVRQGYASWVLHPDLVPLATEKRKFYILFDYEPRKDKARHITRATARLGKALEKLGPFCAVASLPGPQKGVDDWGVAIEHRFLAASAAALPHTEAALARLWVGLIDGFASHQCPLHSETAVRDLLAQAVSLKLYCRRLALPYCFNRLTYPADLTVNERYLADHLPPSKPKLMALKAAKGTGKTEWIARYLERHMRHFDGRRILIPTHRIQLGSALCDRFGLPYLSEKNTLPEGDIFGLGLCINSLHLLSAAQFKPSDWKRCVLVIDEIEQVLWHLLDSATCRRTRVEILKNFRQIIQNASQVIVADADLSDISLDYLKHLVGCDPWILENTYQSEETTWDVTFYEGRQPSQLILNLIEEIQRGGRPLVLTSSQKHFSTWGTRTLEKMFESLFPNLRILRIDSHTVADRTHPAFGALANLNHLLLNYDLVLASPSIETGVSIDIRGHFTSVWAIGTGKQPIHSISQGLARLREPVPRHVWVSCQGDYIADGSIHPQQLIQNTQLLAASKRRCLRASEHLMTLYRADETNCDYNFQPASAQCWAAMAARINAGSLNYRVALMELLEREGHRVRAAPVEDNPAIKRMVQKYRDENYQAYCQRVAMPGRYLDDAQFEALECKMALSEDERETLKHNQIARRYRIPVTQQLVQKDDKGWYFQIQRHYYTGPGREFLGDIVVKHFATDSLCGAVFEPDFAWGNRLEAQARVWEFLGLNALDGVEQILSENDPIAAPIAQRCREQRSAIQMAFGVTISPTARDIHALQTMFRTQGRKLVYLARKRDETGKALRVYSKPVANWVKDDAGKPLKNERGGIVSLSDERELVFEVWNARHIEARTRAQQEYSSSCAVETSVEESPEPVTDCSNLGDGQSPLIDGFSLEDLAEVAQMLTLPNSKEEFEQVFRRRGQYIFSLEIFRAALSFLDEVRANLVRGWLS